MRAALVDVDGHRFPNLALMRLSAWHKSRGDDMEWWNGFTHYDRVYLSKVFAFSQDFDTVINADETITGGTSYKDYTSLPPEVEAAPAGLQYLPVVQTGRWHSDQGLNARLITPKTATLLAGLHWIRFVRLSCDTSAMLLVIEQTTAYLWEAGVAPSRFWAYVLVQECA